jgi:L-fucose isomerase-like protein
MKMPPSWAQSKHGNTPNDAPPCSRQHREEIDGILVSLPNFGDEKGIADAIKLSGVDGAHSGAGFS